MTDPSTTPGPDPAPRDQREGAAEAEEYPRKVLLVAGPGRSGTSTLSGILSLLGLHVPQPEVAADDTNPKGFGEPQWVVDHHDRLLEEAAVTVGDARPSAWLEAARVATREPVRIRTSQWLEGHFAEGSELIVKDPRLSWFLPLWRVAAVRTGATPVFATMLRPPAEVVGSKQKYYRNRLGSAHLAASWINMVLHTERATRPVEAGDSGGRVFVRYEDLLSDWTRTTNRIGEELGLQHVLHAQYEAIRDVHRFVDPSLRRISATPEDLRLPRRLQELLDETWHEATGLADPGGDTSASHAAMDQLREAYVELYEESEAIARSSAVAAAAVARREGPTTTPPPTGPGAAPAPPGLVDRIPHSVRSKVPPGVRRGVRRALGRPRPSPSQGEGAGS